MPATVPARVKCVGERLVQFGVIPGRNDVIAQKCQRRGALFRLYLDRCRSSGGLQIFAGPGCNHAGVFRPRQRFVERTNARAAAPAVHHVIADRQHHIDPGVGHGRHGSMAAGEDHGLLAGRQFLVGRQRHFERRDGQVGRDERLAHAVEHRVAIVQMLQDVVGTAHGDQLAGQRQTEGVADPPGLRLRQEDGDRHRAAAQFLSVRHVADQDANDIAEAHIQHVATLIGDSDVIVSAGASWAASSPAGSDPAASTTTRSEMSASRRSLDATTDGSIETTQHPTRRRSLVRSLTLGASGAGRSRGYRSLSFFRLSGRPAAMKKTSSAAAATI